MGKSHGNRYPLSTLITFNLGMCCVSEFTQRSVCVSCIAFRLRKEQKKNKIWIKTTLFFLGILYLDCPQLKYPFPSFLMYKVHIRTRTHHTCVKANTCLTVSVYPKPIFVGAHDKLIPIQTGIAAMPRISTYFWFFISKSNRVLLRIMDRDGWEVVWCAV